MKLIELEKQLFKKWTTRRDNLRNMEARTDEELLYITKLREEETKYYKEWLLVKRLLYIYAKQEKQERENRQERKR